MKEKKNHAQGAPREEHNGQKPVRKGFLAAAFDPEFKPDSAVHDCGCKSNRYGDNSESVDNAPNEHQDAGSERRGKPGFSLRVKPGTNKKQNAGTCKKTLVHRALTDGRAEAATYSRTKIVEREQAPPGGPAKQVSLAFQVIDIREETCHQRSGDQQGQRN